MLGPPPDEELPELPTEVGVSQLFRGNVAVLCVPVEPLS